MTIRQLNSRLEEAQRRKHVLSLPGLMLMLLIFLVPSNVYQIVQIYQPISTNS